MKISKLKLTKAFKKGQNVAAIIVVGIIFLGQVFVVQISCKRKIYKNPGPSQISNSSS